MDLLILVITCIINLSLGLFVFLRDTRKVYVQLFTSVSVLLTVWIAANYVTNHHIVNLTITDAANKLTYVSGFGVLASGVIFTYFFPLKRKANTFEKYLWVVGSLVIVGLSMTPLISGEVSLDAKGNLSYSVGLLTWVYVLAFVVALFVMTRNLLSIPKSQGDLKIRQARFILVAFGSTAFFGLLLNVIIPLIQGNWDSTRYGPLVTVILVATIAYTIVKHGLFDIRLAVVRSVAYIFSLVTLAGIYYLAAYTFSQVLFRGQGDVISQSPFSILLALILAFIFQPVKRFFDKLTNKFFYHAFYDTDEFLGRLGRQLSHASDLKSLLKGAAGEIAETLQAERVTFIVQQGSRYVTAGTDSKDIFSQGEVARIDDRFNRKHQSTIVTELLSESDSLQHLLNHREIAIVLPILHDPNTLSYLFIGRRRSRNYTNHDTRVLETISNELGIAIQNAFSVQEVKDINATLKQRIEDATKELRESNKQLQKLDEAKDEFVSMASHQLRTPLTSVKGYISMVLEGDVGKITSTQRQLLDEAFTSSERMVHLINDFLNVSRLQTGKFVIEEKATDLAKVISQEVDSLKTTAKAHALTIAYRPPSHFPILYLDEGKIRQVLMNFIDNAIYYSPEGATITVSLAIEDGYAVATVKDEGIGVPEAERAHLFSKFFRASNARKQRPDGTGVGLFLAKKVIVAQGGTMVFESKEGRGSTFGFRLPIKKLSSPSEKSD